MPIGALPAILVLIWVAILCLKDWLHASVAARAGIRGAAALQHEALRPWMHESPYITLGIPIAVIAMLGVGMSGPAMSMDRLRINKRRTETWVYLVGPLFHFVLALLFALPLMGRPIDESPGPLQWLCGALSTLNLEALAFTLLPLPPFDLYRALVPWLPSDAQYPINAPIAVAMMVMAAYFATGTQRGNALIAIVVTHVSSWIGLNPLYCMATFSLMEAFRWVAALTMLSLFGLWYLIQRRR